MKFRIRSLFVLITCVAIAMPFMPSAVPYIWSLRPANAVIVVHNSPVREIFSTVEQHSASLNGIYRIRPDEQTNTIIVTSSARNCDANAEEISYFLREKESEPTKVNIARNSDPP